MTEPTRPTASQSLDSSIKDKALLDWLKTAATNSLPRTDLGSLQIACAAAHADNMEELPTRTWAEYQVIHENHVTLTKAPCSFRKTPSISETSQWRNAKRLKTIDQTLFPASRALGELLNQKPTPNRTMPDRSPFEPLAENIPIRSPETNEEMHEAEDDTPVWPIAETHTRPGEHDEHAPLPLSTKDQVPALAETAIKLTPDPSSSAPPPTPTPSPNSPSGWNPYTNYRPGCDCEAPIQVQFLA
ncbi:hypothetical protein Q9L58_010098 [Maublancomyces gigas]|uniref:Uncharacterized protein n=1 Tax=Discina gigas TaxID=1032678 RepID=A0ABR3G555_9PEZI